MNINCQNSAYVGRTNLSRDEQTHKVLQGEIDTINLNLDITSNTFTLNLETTSNTLHDYTASKFDELWDVNPNNSNGLIKYKNYLTYEDTYLTYSNGNHTYLINCNLNSEI